MAPTHGPPASAPARGGWWVLVGLVAAVWLTGTGFYGYAALQHRRERQATYASVDVSQASVAAVGRAEFVALQGRLHPAGGLVLRTGHQSVRTYFLPLVAPNSAPSDAVQWIARWEGASLPEAEWPLHAHDQGSALAPVVREAFERMGVRIAPDAALVELVPTRAGVALDRDPESLSRAVGVAGLVTVIMLLTGATFAVLGLHGRRSEGRRSARPSA